MRMFFGLTEKKKKNLLSLLFSFFSFFFFKMSSCFFFFFCDEEKINGERDYVKSAYFPALSSCERFKVYGYIQSTRARGGDRER